ncbi:hypothetical protein SDC49_16225 [Lactobacillus sp. R2/2]|nr:hypothetical protein [Lactobacillus sp. R2/2]
MIAEKITTISAKINKLKMQKKVLEEVGEILQKKALLNQEKNSANF